MVEARLLTAWVWLLHSVTRHLSLTCFMSKQPWQGPLHIGFKSFWPQTPVSLHLCSEFHRRFEVGEVSSERACLLSGREPALFTTSCDRISTSPVGISKFQSLFLHQFLGIWGLLDNQFVNHQNFSWLSHLYSWACTASQAWASAQHLTISAVTNRKTLTIQCSLRTSGRRPLKWQRLKGLGRSDDTGCLRGPILTPHLASGFFVFLVSWNAKFHVFFRTFCFAKKTPPISLSELESVKNQVSRHLAHVVKPANVGQTSGRR